MRSVAWLCVALAGCGVTDPLVTVPESCRDGVIAAGMVLATEESIPEVRDPLEVVAFLARWSLTGENRDALIVDADVVASTGEAELPMPHAGDGVYSAADEDPAVYVSGEPWTLAIDSSLGAGTITAVAPQDTRFVLPDPGEHPAGVELAVDLSDQGFDIARAVVIDGVGDLVWRSIEPNVWQHHAWLREDGPVTSVTLPAEALPEADAGYHVGIAGLVRASPDGFDGLDPECSVFAVGRMAVRTIRTAP